jgi:hypothetical protein
MRMPRIRLKYAVMALALLSSTALADPLPFEISVDGHRVDGTTLPPAVTRDASGEPPAPAERKGLDAADIQVKYSGLNVRPILNVSTVPPRTAYRAGEEVKFLMSLNYAAWIERAEIRVYEAGRRRNAGIVETIEVDPSGAAVWSMPEDVPPEMEYVVRVYDADGRYDETRPLPLIRTDRAELAQDDKRAVAPGYSEDFTAVRNIDVSGGAVTVSGKNIPFDHTLEVMGEEVPVDGNGSFVVQRLLPSGQGSVEISVLKDGEGLRFSRAVEIPDSEWFYVGIADFTAGWRFGNEIEAVRPGDFDDVYTRGRVAFYAKGKIKGKYILTAAMDTDEVKLKRMFKELDDKNPREFLRRLDPDDYYPVYGDDSTAFEDAPTRGKFYIRLDKGLSHVMWGNFKSEITGTRFLRTERALYGANAVYKSQGVTRDGEAKTQATAYAALPGTLPQRDELRGTGGSAYFLKYQDITQGSETVNIEVRNRTTGFVVERRQLTFGRDYSIDYVQGVIILTRPLRSTDRTGSENFLTVSYEFTPAARNVDGYVAGARAQQWIGDHVRVGVTAQREKTGSANQKLYGADVRLQKTPDTYVEAEVARSKGPGFGNSYSPDGGLTIQDNGTAGQVNRKANAYRFEARVELADVTDGKSEGKLQARYEYYQKGFSSLDTQANEKKTAWGVEGDVKVTERVRVAVSYSQQDTGDGTADREGFAKARIAVSEHVAIEPYGSYTERKRVRVNDDDAGKRANVGGRLIYTWNENEELYVFGQATVARGGSLRRDHRAGVGANVQLTEKVSASGEASYGTLGFGADLQLNYEPNAEDRYYIGYRLDADRDGSSSWPFELIGDDLGTIVAGARVQYNEQWAGFAEDSYDVFGERRSLTQTYGVNYTPTEEWSFAASTEIGQVEDNTRDPRTGEKNTDFDRKAFSAEVRYEDEDRLTARLKGEMRFDNSDDDTRDLDSYLLSADVMVKLDPNWRAIGTLDAVFTDATEAIKDGDYMEGSFGFAYRPIDSDRLNALVKYTFLLDEPGGDQVTVDGNKNGDQQRSHIFSADVNYDLAPQVTVGAKYGLRIGERRERVRGADWENSEAHLGVLRADLHIVHEWDALIEGRILWSPTTDQTDLGLLLAVYKQMGDNFKVGVGYNFGSFSDDLRDLTLDDGGVFLNVVGKI